jgi:extradiol dioxygenase family protein
VSVVLDHLVIVTRDKQEGAQFMADVLGLEVGPAFGHFLPIELDNGVTLDFYTHEGHHEEVAHYAFRVTEAGFDHGRSRLEALDVTYYATPWLDRAGEINTNDGGRGLYFLDPTGNTMELITVPYGGRPKG